jgi:hypothetical protein
MLQEINDFEPNLKVWLVKEIMRHRKISRQDLVTHMGKGKTVINDTLRPGLRSRTTMEGWQRNLDLIESAITSITEERGGIPSACCSQDQLDNVAWYLDEGRLG